MVFYGFFILEAYYRPSRFKGCFNDIYAVADTPKTQTFDSVSSQTDSLGIQTTYVVFSTRSMLDIHLDQRAEFHNYLRRKRRTRLHRVTQVCSLQARHDKPGIETITGGR